jgi:hypothetical protein
LASPRRTGDLDLDRDVDRDRARGVRDGDRDRGDGDGDAVRSMMCGAPRRVSIVRVCPGLFGGSLYRFCSGPRGT